MGKYGTIYPSTVADKIITAGRKAGYNIPRFKAEQIFLDKPNRLELDEYLEEYFEESNNVKKKGGR